MKFVSPKKSVPLRKSISPQKSPLKSLGRKQQSPCKLSSLRESPLTSLVKSKNNCKSSTQKTWEIRNLSDAKETVDDFNNNSFSLDSENGFLEMPFSESSTSKELSSRKTQTVLERTPSASKQLPKSDLVRKSLNFNSPEISLNNESVLLDTAEKKSQGMQSNSSTGKDRTVINFGRTKVSNKPVTQAEQITLVSLVVDNRNKLESIERLVTSILRAVKPSQKIVIPKELPNLPLNSIDSFDENEEFLSDKANSTDTSDYLSKFVNLGLKTKDQIYTLLRKTLSDKLACNFNWTKGKMAFQESKLYNVLIGAVLDAHSDDSPSKIKEVVQEADEAVKIWLKNAPKRRDGTSSNKKSPKKKSSPRKSPKKHAS